MIRKRIRSGAKAKRVEWDINQGRSVLGSEIPPKSGHIFLTGIQALAGLPMAQIRRRPRPGLNYRGLRLRLSGSPLGGYDQQLFAAAKHLSKLQHQIQARA